MFLREEIQKMQKIKILFWERSLYEIWEYACKDRLQKTVEFVAICIDLFRG